MSHDDDSTAASAPHRPNLEAAAELWSIYHELLGAGFSDKTLEGWAKHVDAPPIWWDGRSTARDIAFDIVRSSEHDARACSSEIEGFQALGFSDLTSRHFARWMHQRQVPWSCMQVALEHLHHHFDTADVVYAPIGDDNFQSKDKYISKEVPDRKDPLTVQTCVFSNHEGENPGGGIETIGDLIATENLGVPSDDDHIMMYHGTTADAIESLSLGIDTYRSCLGGFSNEHNGFYLTSDARQAVDWAHLRYERTKRGSNKYATVFVFKVSKAAIEADSLIKVVYVGTDTPLDPPIEGVPDTARETVWAYRRVGVPPRDALERRVHWIEGQYALNSNRARSKDELAFKDNSHQVCIKRAGGLTKLDRDNAIDLLDASWVGVACLM
eukprot:m.157350 g.157350  ORF g.157350 m.157350 type:complete len:383 (+) comp11727_c0_seq18:374-1522(+)